MVVPPDLVADAVAETRRSLWLVVDADWSVPATEAPGETASG
jgi:hypothetical protein